MKRVDRGGDRVAPKRQNNWDWRAAANFMCGGAGGGLLVWAAVAAEAGGTPRAAVALAMLLVATGLTCVWFEIGRPWRALNVFLHPAGSWMTREALVAPALFAAGAAAFALGGAWFLLAGVGGAAFLYSQARILQADKGIPTWRHPRSLGLMLATGLAEGLALLLLSAPALTTANPRAAGIGLIVIAALRMLAWKHYLAGVGAPGVAPLKAVTALRAEDGRFVAVGHLLPAVLALAGIVSGAAALLWLAALAVAGAGLWIKFALVRRAAFTQGFALPHLPVRGKGRATAGPRPGWV